MPLPHADHGAWTVDRAVRALATACAHADRSTPAVLTIVVGLDTIWFRLATPDERPPTGWTAEHDGRTWYAALRWLQSVAVDELPHEPYPQLVSLGATGDGSILLNLGQAGGVVSLDGDARQARALAETWTRELTTSPWAQGVQVARVGFKAGPDDPVGGTEAESLADAEPALADPGGGVLLFAAPPAGRDRERIQRLTDDPVGQWSVVVVGSVEDARWRFTVDSTGQIDTEILEGPAIRRPDPPAEAPTRLGATADATGQPPTATARPRGRFASLFATRRGVFALVVFLCLIVAASLIAVPALTRQSSNQSAADSSPTNAAENVPSDGAGLSNSVSPLPTSAPASVPSSGAGTTSSKASASRSPTATVAPGGTGMVRSVSTGLCVDSDANPAMALNGTPSGGHAFYSTCDSAASQQWSEGPLLSQDSPRDDDLYRLVNRQTGFCLDSGEQDTYTLPCLDPDTYQVWQRLQPSSTTVAYRNTATNRCLVASAEDSTLSTQACPTGATWPNNMLFRRTP